jgi:hypothetical protein
MKNNQQEAMEFKLYKRSQKVIPPNAEKDKNEFSPLSPAELFLLPFRKKATTSPLLGNPTRGEEEKGKGTQTLAAIYTYSSSSIHPALAKSRSVSLAPSEDFLRGDCARKDE